MKKLSAFFVSSFFVLCITFTAKAEQADEANHLNIMAYCTGAAFGTIVLIASKKHFGGTEGIIVGYTAGTLTGVEIFKLIIRVFSDKKDHDKTHKQSDSR